MKKSKKKWVIAAVVVCVVIGGITIAFHSFESKRAAIMQKQSQDVAAVKKGNITVKVNGSGEITSEATAGLKPERPGTISDIAVENNSEVKKGDVLISFEEDGIESIVAPFDGTVYFPSEIEEGTQVNPELTAATVFDPKKLEMVAKLDELDINQVKAGQKADISVDAFPDETFSGTVKEVASMGEKAEGEAYSTFRVVIDISDDQKLKPGMTAEAEILTQDKKDVLLVPVEAVRKKGEAYYVQVASGSTGPSGSMMTTEKEVEAGVHNERMMEITKGLAEGEKVVVPGTEETTGESKIFGGNKMPAGERRGLFGGGGQ